MVYIYLLACNASCVPYDPSREIHAHISQTPVAYNLVLVTMLSAVETKSLGLLLSTSPNHTYNREMCCHFGQILLVL